VRVTLLVTCVVDVLAPDVGTATVRALRRAGHEVRFDDGQTCCGQPAWNAGHAREAAAVARPTLAALERELDAGAEAVVVPAGSCAAMVVRGWPALFEGEERERAERVASATWELTAFLAAHGTPAERAAAPGTSPRVAWHHACHGLRELHLGDEQVDAVLGAAGVERVAWAAGDAERCCGFGGLFSVTLPEVSVAMADAKLDSLPDCDVVAATDVSCLVHLRSRAAATGRPVRTAHVAELLARPPEPERRGGG
jgi:L-lactate dehydrogenase complex protein LldE